MPRGYELAGTEFFESEELPEFNPPVTSVYGIIGVTAKGPKGPTSINSVKQLHNTFGYAYLGKDGNGNRLISQGIAAAERILEYTTNVIFCRVGISAEDEKKFVCTTAGKLNYTVANNDSTIKSIRVEGDGSEVSVICVYEHTNGEIMERYLASNVLTEKDLKVALEYEGTLQDVTVPLNYFNQFNVEDGAAPVVDEFVVQPGTIPSNMTLEEEIGYFENSEAVDVSVLIAPVGFFLEIGAETFEEKRLRYDRINARLIELVTERKDCMAGLSYPIDITYEQFISMFGQQWYTGLDCDQVCTAYPSAKIKNFYTNDLYEADAGSLIARQMAFTDNKTKAWFAPAGFGDSRGVIPDIVSLNDVLTKKKRKEITDIRVNPIVNFVGHGTALFGNRTFKYSAPYEEESYYTQISVRRLMNYVRKQVIYISLNIVFSPNDPTFWTSWVNRVTEKLENIKNHRGIQRYRVLMDETTVTAEDIRNKRAPGIIYVQPIGAIEYIPVYCTVTDSGVYFGVEEVTE